MDSKHKTILLLLVFTFCISFSSAGVSKWDSKPVTGNITNIYNNVSYINQTVELNSTQFEESEDVWSLSETWLGDFIMDVLNTFALGGLTISDGDATVNLQTTGITKTGGDGYYGIDASGNLDLAGDTVTIQSNYNEIQGPTTFTDDVTAPNLLTSETDPLWESEKSDYALTSDVHSIPNAGNIGEVLSKISGGDYEVAWTDLDLDSKLNVLDFWDYILDYYNKSEVYKKSETYNKTQVDDLFQTKSNCVVREKTDFVGSATPFDNYIAVAVSTGTFVHGQTTAWYLANSQYFDDRVGVWAFKTHATNDDSGARLYTSARETIDMNTSKLYRANVFFPNVTNGTSVNYAGENIRANFGFVGTTSCFQPGSGSGGSALINIREGKLQIYQSSATNSSTGSGTTVYDGTEAGMGGVTNLSILALPANTWLVVEVEVNRTTPKIYGRIYNQETGVLLWNVSAWASALTYFEQTALVGTSICVDTQTINTSAVPIAFIDWVDFCQKPNIQNSRVNWGKIE
jgi:hypothetical protein